MTKEERNKKMNEKFKNIFSKDILSSKWDKEGVEVSCIINKIYNNYL
jgi:hypothetical protein